jgi:hypothetical protein
MPICPQINDLYVAVDEVPIPKTAAQMANPIPSLTVVLTDPMKMLPNRDAYIMATFAATPGQAGYSPVCRMHFYNKTMLDCGNVEQGVPLPRPLCTAQQIEASGAVITTASDSYVHCLFLQPQSPSQ